MVGLEWDVDWYLDRIPRFVNRFAKPHIRHHTIFANHDFHDRFFDVHLKVNPDEFRGEFVDESKLDLEWKFDRELVDL